MNDAAEMVSESGRYYHRYYQCFTNEIRGLNRPQPIEWRDRTEDPDEGNRYFRRFYIVYGDEIHQKS